MVKKAWEMTKNEFKSVPIQKTTVGYRGYFGVIKAQLISAPDGKVYKVVPITKDTPFWTEYRRKKSRWKYAVLNGRGEDTRIRLHKVNELYDIIHKKAVERALKEGKHVPEKVLKDYPDLLKKYGKISKPTQRSKKSVNKREALSKKYASMTKNDLEALFAKRSKRSRSVDMKKRAKKVIAKPEDYFLWVKTPSRYDIKGIDTPKNKSKK